MFESVKEYARKRSLRKHPSDVRTAVEPLSGITSVAVYVDANGPYFLDTVTEIHRFFGQYGIRSNVYALATGIQTYSEGRIKATFFHEQSINWYGRIKRGKQYLPSSAGEDMFISLYPGSFAVQYEACCSRARFKAGRAQLDGHVFDLVFCGEQAEGLTDLEAFRKIEELLIMIK